MKKIQPDLWETDVESPFPGLTTHAYLFVREDGNVLFYNTGHLHEIDRMEALGGVRYQYLSHRDEVGDTLNIFKQRFGAKLGGHLREREEFARVREPDILFKGREVHLESIEVIPTPGHTPGSTCFLVSSEHGKRYLFTGDTLYLSKDGWRAGLLSFSEREPLMESLGILRGLKPDIALSSAFAGDFGFQEVKGKWSMHVDKALVNLSG